jgi:CRP-like cAMP-binding protein
VRVLENPKLALAMIQMAAMRSVEIGYRLESFCFDGNSCRLARALIRFSDRFGKMTKRGESRMPALSHKLLAQYIGTWRESVTQHMNEFRDEGYVNYSRQGISVRRDSLGEFVRTNGHRLPARKAAAL